MLSGAIRSFYAKDCCAKHSLVANLSVWYNYNYRLILLESSDVSAHECLGGWHGSV